MNLEFTKLIESKGHNSPVYCLSNYKERQIISGGGEGWIARWSLDHPENGVLIADVNNSIFSLTYLDDLDLIIAGDRNGGLHWIGNSGESIDKIVHDAEIFCICRVGKFVYTLGGNGWMVKWDIQGYKALQSIQICYDSLRSFLPHSDPRFASIGVGNGNIYTVDLDDFEVISQSTAHSGTVFSLELNNIGNVISGGKDAHLKLWSDLSTLELLKDIPAHWYAIYAIKLHPHLPIVATASRDKNIRIWSAETLEPILTLDYAKYQGHIRSVNDLIWSDDGELLISTGDDRSIIFWKLESRL